MSKETQREIKKSFDKFRRNVKLQLSGGGKLSPEKKRLKAKIDKLQAAAEKISGERARNAMQKKIDKLQAQLDHNPTFRQRIAAAQGRFYIEIPSAYRQRMYKALWSMGIKPKMHTLANSTKVVVDNTAKLQKAYGLYSGFLTGEGKKVPAMQAVTGKL